MLVVWGDQDRLVPRRLVDGLTELHSAWAFRAMAGTGHLLPLEAPHLYVELVADWIGGRTERALGRAAP